MVQIEARAVAPDGSLVLAVKMPWYDLREAKEWVQSCMCSAKWWARLSDYDTARQVARVEIWRKGRRCRAHTYYPFWSYEHVPPMACCPTCGKRFEEGDPAARPAPVLDLR